MVTRRRLPDIAHRHEAAHRVLILALLALAVPAPHVLADSATWAPSRPCTPCSHYHGHSEQTGDNTIGAPKPRLAALRASTQNEPSDDLTGTDFLLLMLLGVVGILIICALIGIFFPIFVAIFTATVILCLALFLAGSVVYVVYVVFALAIHLL